MDTHSGASNSTPKGPMIYDLVNGAKYSGNPKHASGNHHEIIATEADMQGILSPQTNRGGGLGGPGGSTINTLAEPQGTKLDHGLQNEDNTKNDLALADHKNGTTIFESMDAT